MTAQDRKQLHKRGVIESVIDILKNTCNIGQSMHRSPLNAMVSVVGGAVGVFIFRHEAVNKEKEHETQGFYNSEQT